MAATVLLIAPVAMHRLLFRRHRLVTLVSAAHRCAYAGLLLLGVALAGVTVVIFGAVLGVTIGVAAGVCALVLFAAFWLAGWRCRWRCAVATSGHRRPSRAGWRAGHGHCGQRCRRRRC
jgi:Family of unknown function (DUF6328)